MPILDLLLLFGQFCHIHRIEFRVRYMTERATYTTMGQQKAKGTK